VTISNDRILSCAEGQVRFRYRDRRDGDRQKVERLPADEFIGRFLQHVLPDQFTRIRHYGFLSSRNQSRCLEQIRQLIGAAAPRTDGEAGESGELPGASDPEPPRCPCCQAPLHIQPVAPVLAGHPALAPRGPP
jgi:hypothetical protein